MEGAGIKLKRAICGVCTIGGMNIGIKSIGGGTTESCSLSGDIDISFNILGEIQRGDGTVDSFLASAFSTALLSSMLASSKDKFVWP